MGQPVRRTWINFNVAPLPVTNANVTSGRDRAGRTKARHEAGPLRTAVRSIRASRIVFAQELIANERIGVAADHAVAGHDVARLNGHAWTEAIIRIGLGVVGLAAVIPL